MAFNYTVIPGFTGVGFADLSCGSYSKQADIEAACNADSDCLAYTFDPTYISTPSNGWWCLKTSSAPGQPLQGGFLFAKIVSSGK